MSDPTREAFARSLADAIGEHLNVSDFMDLSSLGSAQIDGYVDLLGVATEILATYLVVPRSEVVVEHDRPWTPARHRESWIGPWSPLLENGDGRG